jgi:hypothetical protein
MIQVIGEKPLNGIASIFVGRQADAMNDQKVNGRTGGTRIVIGGCHAANAA